MTKHKKFNRLCIKNHRLKNCKLPPKTRLRRKSNLWLSLLNIRKNQNQNNRIGKLKNMGQISMFTIWKKHQYIKIPHLIKLRQRMMSIHNHQTRKWKQQHIRNQSVIQNRRVIKNHLKRKSKWSIRKFINNQKRKHSLSNNKFIRNHQVKRLILFTRNHPRRRWNQLTKNTTKNHQPRKFNLSMTIKINPIRNYQWMACNLNNPQSRK